MNICNVIKLWYNDVKDRVVVLLELELNTRSFNSFASVISFCWHFEVVIVVSEWCWCATLIYIVIFYAYLHIYCTTRWRNMLTRCNMSRRTTLMRSRVTTCRPGISMLSCTIIAQHAIVICWHVVTCYDKLRWNGIKALHLWLKINLTPFIL